MTPEAIRILAGMVYVRKHKLPLAYPKCIYRDEAKGFMYIPSFHLRVTPVVFKELVKEGMIYFSGYAGDDQCWEMTDKGKQFASGFEFNDKWAVTRDGRQVALDEESQYGLEAEADSFLGVDPREA